MVRMMRNAIPRAEPFPIGTRALNAFTTSLLAANSIASAVSVRYRNRAIK